MATPVIDVDLTNPATFAGGIPQAVFARVRREDPVAWHPSRAGGFWSLTRHADVVAANRDTESLSPARLGTMIFDRRELAEPDAARMLTDMDAPQHTRYRRLV